MNRLPSLFVYGAGRTGLAVARLAERRGVRLAGVWSPRPLRPPRMDLAGGLDLEIAVAPSPKAADLWLLAVPDDAVADLARGLAEALDAEPTAPRPRAAAHCAGAHPAALLEPLRERSIPAASWHPAMTFRGAADDADALAGARIAIEGDPAAVDLARALAAALGATAVLLATGAKPWYHAALVFAANGRVVLDAVATRLLSEAGIAGDEARALLAPLVARAEANLSGAAAAEALTGPVARGDARTVRVQVEALADRPLALDLYRALGRVALELVPEHHRGDGHREVARLLGADIDPPEGTPC
ncbi:MAG: DUF2520 domain-containing protein [Gemmatimonadetes bacterium]|nr:DUF2520 domain-containing protein [Gemmatimonadota bacterium]